jgi:hypothetical protein
VQRRHFVSFLLQEKKREKLWDNNKVIMPIISILPGQY